jgi:FixJ family two-component response regulator
VPVARTDVGCHGHSPDHYASAEAFLADAKHPQFDCLVLDIQLGGMSGIELAQEQRLLAARRIFEKQILVQI